MRKTFLTESLARLLRGAIGIACLTAACVSCETHSNSDRSESIAVYADPIEKKPVDAVYVGVQGGQAKIYAEANVDFVASWEDDADMPGGSPGRHCGRPADGVPHSDPRRPAACRNGLLLHAAHGYADSGGDRRDAELQPHSARTPRFDSSREQRFLLHEVRQNRSPLHGRRDAHRRLDDRPEGLRPPRQSTARSTPTATARTAI